MTDARQCMWCGRVGYIAFVRYQSHWLCKHPRACDRRRRRGIPPSRKAGRMTVEAP